MAVKISSSPNANLAPKNLNYMVKLGGTVDCTGTLISPKHVLTTASCFVDEWGDAFWDYLYQTPESTLLTVDNSQVGLGLGLSKGIDIYIPDTYGPEYQPTYKEYYSGNIAVVHIPALSGWGYDARYPSLPTFRSQVTNANNTFVVGAGESEDAGNAVRYAPYTIVGDLGVAPPGSTIEIESDHFTAESDAGASLCIGDHGAAMIELYSDGDCSSQDILLGLNSWTSGWGCFDDGVAAYVDVLSHVNFIQDAMSGSIEPSIQM